jgi:hypothetical protein
VDFLGHLDTSPWQTYILELLHCLLFRFEHDLPLWLAECWFQRVHLSSATSSATLTSRNLSRQRPPQFQTRAWMSSHTWLRSILLCVFLSTACVHCFSCLDYFIGRVVYRQWMLDFWIYISHVVSSSSPSSHWPDHDLFCFPIDP